MIKKYSYQELGSLSVELESSILDLEHATVRLVPKDTEYTNAGYNSFSIPMRVVEGKFLNRDAIYHLSRLDDENSLASYLITLGECETIITIYDIGSKGIPLSVGGICDLIITSKLLPKKERVLESSDESVSTGFTTLADLFHQQKLVGIDANPCLFYVAQITENRIFASEVVSYSLSFPGISDVIKSHENYMYLTSYIVGYLKEAILAYKDKYGKYPSATIHNYRILKEKGLDLHSVQFDYSKILTE